MKHIKQYENWTTSNTGNYNVNYGDNKKLSYLTIIIKDYIYENFNDITEIRNGEVLFNENVNMKSISIYYNDEEDINIVRFYNRNSNLRRIIEITADEFNDILEIMKEAKNNKIKNRELDVIADDILTELIPHLRDAKKYNV